MTRHKHADLIIAWANGAEIQFKRNTPPYDWLPCQMDTPSWSVNNEYRIKPEPKPDRIVYLQAYYHNGQMIKGMTSEKGMNTTLEITIDGETETIKHRRIIND